MYDFFYQGYFFSALLATFNCGFYFLSEHRAKSSQFKTQHDVGLFEFWFRFTQAFFQ